MGYLPYRGGLGGHSKLAPLYKGSLSETATVATMRFKTRLYKVSELTFLPKTPSMFLCVNGKMQETKSYDRPTEGCPSFSSVAALIQLKQIRTAYHVHSWFVTTAEQVLTTAAKHAHYSLRISKAFINSLTEDQSDAGSSKAKVNATHAGKAIESASVKMYVGHNNGLG